MQKNIRPGNIHRKRKPFVFFVIIVMTILVFGGLVMLLWNAILPKVTSASPLSYWQAVGLLILSKILFGGLNHWMRFPKGTHSWKNKWMRMSSEERSHFKHEWKKRCRQKEGDNIDSAS